MPKALKAECVMTGHLRKNSQMLRFVKGFDGQVWFDPSGKADGQDVYLLPEKWLDSDSLEVLATSLSAEVASDFRSRTENQIKKALLQRIGLLKKAGRLILGLNSVNTALKEQKVRVVLMAEDAGKNALMKTEKWCEFGARVFAFGLKEEFSSQLGVENCMVIGLSIGADAKHLLEMIEVLVEMKLACEMQA